MAEYWTDYARVVRKIAPDLLNAFEATGGWAPSPIMGNGTVVIQPGPDWVLNDFGCWEYK
jgi:hypothetical protein